MSVKARVFILIVAIFAVVFFAQETRRRKRPVEPVFTLPTTTPAPVPEPIDLDPLPRLPPPQVPTEPAPADVPPLPLPEVSRLQDWLGQMALTEESGQAEWLARGIALAEARRTEMAELIQTDPKEALARALTPRQYAALPAEVQALVERPIAAEGFYGVLAICGHEPGAEHIEGACEIRHEAVLGFGTFDAEAFQASIYGEREQKLTVEQDSLYGVAMDGHIALHEHEAVIVDDGEGAKGGRYALYHRGDVHYSDDLEALQAMRERLLTTP